MANPTCKKQPATGTSTGRFRPAETADPSGRLDALSRPSSPGRGTSRTARPVLLRAALSWLAAALLVAPAACSSIDNVTVSAEGQAVIPERSVIDDLLGNLTFVGFDEFDISQSQEFRDQGYTKDQIDSVHMAGFTLTIAAPEGGNFDFLETIRFSLSSDGLPDLEIAGLDPVPDGATELQLDIDTSVELRPYVVAPAVTITTDATGVRPAEETTVQGEAVFDVDVDVSGALP